MKNELIAAGLVVLTCAGCGGGGSAGTSSSPPELLQPTLPGPRPSCMPDAAMQQKWGIEVGQLARTAVSSTIAVPGSLSLDQEHTARITSLLEGTGRVHRRAGGRRGAEGPGARHGPRPGHGGGQDGVCAGGVPAGSCEA